MGVRTSEQPTGAVDAGPRRLAVRVRRVPGMPVMAARVLLRGGVRAEAIPGQALVAGRLLAEGSRRRDFRQINRQAEDLGMLVQSFATYESTGVAVDALAADWRQALDWLAELALEPGFPADRFEWLRRQAAAELDSLLEEPETLTSRAFLEQLYRRHPYGRLLHGNTAGLRRLRVEDCADFHRQAMQHGAVVVVTGDVDEDAVHRHLGEVFAPLDGEAVADPGPPPPRRGRSRRQQLQAGDTDQAHFYAGQLTVRRGDPDLPLLDLAAVALGAGAGLSGRLPERIRERRGLAYSVGVALTAGAGIDAGRMVIYAGTAAANLDDLEAAVREELVRLLEDGLDEREVEESRAYLVGREPFRRETARQWAARLAEAEFYGLPSDRPDALERRLAGVDAAEVDRALRRVLDAGRLCLTIGLPGRRR